MSRIAIWVHGGIGGGFFSQGQPAIQQLVERLATHFEVNVFSLLPPNRDFLPRGYKIYHAGHRVVPRAFGWVYLTAHFFRLHVKKRYRLVYAFWGYPAGALVVLLGKLAGVPSVIHLQGGDAVSLPRLKYGVFLNPFRAAICRLAYSRSTYLIALTSFQLSCLKNSRVNREPVVIPFGPDTGFFEFSSGRLRAEMLRFLHIGNLTPVKGQEVMLRTFSQVVRHRPAQLTIIGAGFQEGRLKQLCASLEIEPFVKFLGPQPYLSMPRFYRDADILLHTPWYEGQGLVIAEAAACGTLVAGTRVGMLADMGDDCALVVEPGESDQLASKILAFLAAPGTLEKMQHNARRWVQEKDVNYTERKIVAALKALLHANTQAY